MVAHFGAVEHTLEPWRLVLEPRRHTLASWRLVFEPWRHLESPGLNQEPYAALSIANYLPLEPWGVGWGAYSGAAPGVIESPEWASWAALRVSEPPWWASMAHDVSWCHRVYIHCSKPIFRLLYKSHLTPGTATEETYTSCCLHAKNLLPLNP
jgi:hypothetical protein